MRATHAFCDFSTEVSFFHESIEELSRGRICCAALGGTIEVKSGASSRSHHATLTLAPREQGERRVSDG
jgi:hypothetical protein